MVVQPGLCRTWSETPKTGFVTTRLILLNKYLISTFVFAIRIVQSLFYLLKSGISSLQPSSVVVQPGLCRTWSETPKTGFLTTRLILLNKYLIETCYTESSNATTKVKDILSKGILYLNKTLIRPIRRLICATYAKIGWLLFVWLFFELT